MKRVLIITRNPLVHPRQMKDGRGITEDGRDSVVINSKGLRETTTFTVPRSRTILVTDEPYSVLAYAKGYYQQFGTVVTTQREILSIKETHVIHMHTLLPWYVGMTWEPDQHLQAPLQVLLRQR